MTGNPGLLGAADGGQRQQPRRARIDLAADAERLTSLVPEGALRVSEAELRARARQLVLTRAGLDRRRADLGGRPSFDAAAERAVVAARQEADRARRELSVAAAAGHRLLALGNACGVAMIGASVVAVLNGVSPLSTPVSIAVMASAGGPIGALVGGWRTRVAARQVHAGALTAWSDALARTGFDTMGALAAARLRHDAWRERCREVEAAAEAEQVARARWEEVVGAGIDPVAVGALASAVRQLRAMRLAQLEHALADLVAARTPAPPVIDLDRLSATRALPPAGEPTPARVAPVVLVPRPVEARSPQPRRRRRSPNHPALAGLAGRGAATTLVAARPALAPAESPVSHRDPTGAEAPPPAESPVSHRDPTGAKAPAPALAEPPTSPSDRGEGAESRVLDLLERIKDKGLRLWGD